MLGVIDDRVSQRHSQGQLVIYTCPHPNGNRPRDVHVTYLEKRVAHSAPSGNLSTGWDPATRFCRRKLNVTGRDVGEAKSYEQRVYESRVIGTVDANSVSRAPVWHSGTDWNLKLNM